MSPALRRASAQPSSNDVRPRRHAWSPMIVAAPNPNRFISNTANCPKLTVSCPSGPFAANARTSVRTTPAKPISSGTTAIAGLRTNNPSARTYIIGSTPRNCCILAPSPRQCRPARTRTLVGDVFDNLIDGVFHALVIRSKNLHNFSVRHRFDPMHAFKTNVVIRNQRNIHVTHLKLTREIRFRIVGHINNLPPQRREPLRLSPRRKPRPLNDDDGPLIMRGDPDATKLLDGNRPQLRTIRIGKTHMRRNRPIIKRIL